MKKRFAVLAAVLMLALSGCASTAQNTKDTENIEEAQSSVKVTDLLGREVEVVDALKGWQKDLAERTADIKDSEKPRVFTGACSFKGGHGIEGTYTNFPPFTAIGALNVADELSDKSGGVIVDLEQIAVWDPDYIFLTPTICSL